MIQFKVASSGFPDGWIIHLPAVPRSGDTVEINGVDFVALSVKFSSGNTVVTLSIEQVQ